MKKLIILVVFLLAITLPTKTVMAQDNPNTLWTGDIHQIAVESQAKFSKAQFFVSQTVWLTKNDKPTKVEFVEKGKEKGKAKVIDLRYQITTETKGTVAHTDSMLLKFLYGSSEVSVMVPVLWINFDFSKCKKEKEIITVPFVLKPVITDSGVMDWRTCEMCQFEIAPFFSVSGNDFTKDFTKKQERMDYYRVTGIAVAQADKELLKQLKVAKDLKVQ